MDSNAIRMYWWEGYYGIPYVVHRLRHRRCPFVQNFGDQISPFIVSSLAGKPVEYRTQTKKLLALGSIFFCLSDDDIVWGSGLLRPEHLIFAKRARNVRYLAVRGPRTYDALKSIGIDCPQVFGDPAQLLPLLLEDDITKVHEVGIVPHFSHLPHFQNEFAGSSIRIINTEQPFPKVIRDILSCKAILSTSLHGLIIAEAYGLPALLVVDKNPLHGSLFKFEDYFHATGRELLFRRTDSQKVDKLIDLAYQAKRPSFDHANLLRAFPYNLHTEKKSISVLSDLQPHRLHLHQLSKHILANLYVRHG